MKKVVIAKEVLIQKLNSGKNKEEISEDLGISRVTLNKLIRNYAIEHEYKYNRIVSSKRVACNVAFFDVIDTEEKAYVFGFFLADGWITSNSKRLGFAVRDVDVDILQKIQVVMEHTGNLRKYVNSSGSKMVELNIGSKYIVNALTSIGVSTDKSFTADIPRNIPSKLMPSLLRGLFDGDGSFSGGFPVLVTSSLSLKETIENYCSNNYGSTPSDYSQYPEGGVPRYRLGFKKDLVPLLDDMYSNPSIVMNRKHESYINYRIKKSTEAEDKKPQR